MPRGIRAHHGPSVVGNVHGHGSGAEDFELVQAEFDYLPASCWCSSLFVLASQREVARGETRSCGSRTCRPPDLAPGEPYVVGPVFPGHKVTRSGYTVDEARQRFGDQLGEVRRRELRQPPRRPTLRVVADRGSSPSIRQRRERVVTMHRLGHAARNIADRLNLPVGTVWNDLYTTGAVRPRSHAPKKGRADA